MEAVLRGLAPDGGLYMLPEIPFLYDRVRGERNYLVIAQALLTALLPGYSPEEIEACVCGAYDEKFDTPEIAPTHFAGEHAVLELYHGPTAAFKDMALSILPRLMTCAKKKLGAREETLILTATSGDTGSAAICGFQDIPGIRIVVFYPDAGVSRVQRAQMVTNPGKNVEVCAIRGNFDDAQSGVKRIFSTVDPAKEIPEREVRFSSANSINIGRLAPQTAYYFKAYADCVAAGYIKEGEKLNFSVPTGNFGDILAGYLAKKAGLPVGTLICASNVNRVLTDFWESGVYDRNRAFEKSISPSMDILISSNLERLIYLMCGEDTERVAGWMKSLSENGRYEVGEEMKARLHEEFFAACATDEETMRAIAEAWRENRYLIDPHTAVAWKAMRDFERARPGAGKTVVLSTASPYKFPESVLRALGEEAKGDSFELIDRLQAATNAPLPAGFAGLREKAEKHTDVIDRDDMARYVLEKARKAVW